MPFVALDIARNGRLIAAGFDPNQMSETITPVPGGVRSVGCRELLASLPEHLSVFGAISRNDLERFDRLPGFGIDDASGDDERRRRSKNIFLFAGNQPLPRQFHSIRRPNVGLDFVERRFPPLPHAVFVGISIDQPKLDVGKGTSPILEEDVSFHRPTLVVQDADADFSTGLHCEVDGIHFRLDADFALVDGAVLGGNDDIGSSWWATDQLVGAIDAGRGLANVVVNLRPDQRPRDECPLFVGDLADDGQTTIEHDFAAGLVTRLDFELAPRERHADDHEVGVRDRNRDFALGTRHTVESPAAGGIGFEIHTDTKLAPISGTFPE